MKGTAMISTIVFVIGVLMIVGSVAIYFASDNTSAGEFTEQLKILKGDMSKYALKNDVDLVRQMTMEVSGRTDLVKGECSAAVTAQTKGMVDDIAILKSRIGSAELLKAKQERHVVHTHTYTKPMAVELTYPEKVQSKGKGRRALLERARQ